ncbi:MAG: adenylate/guanylate cyclase domain-containing protein [Lachnospiraceae bacterium]|nr:adenylate/guanylate cyclase domain-containing protein [Lachnospiraceae bacterium]
MKRKSKNQLCALAALKHRNGMKAAAITAAVVLTSYIFLYFGAAGLIDQGVSDRLNQRESVTNKKIYIIGIDDKTLERYGPVNTWSREIPAELVSILNHAPGGGPAVIGFDVIYSEEADEAADDYFAEVCGETGNVVAAMSFSFKEQPERGADGSIVYNPYYVDHVIEPYDSLRDRVMCGFANTFVDDDGYVRQAMAYLDYEGERVYSLSSRVYMEYQQSRGEEVILPDTYGRNNRFYFSYSGKPGGYSVVSMADVLDGTVDAAIFRDAVVLVGAYAVGMQDAYMPAIAHNSQMYGVEIHANIIEALLEGRTQLPITPWVYAAAGAVLCGLFYGCTRKLRLLYSTVLLGAGIALNVIATRGVYRQGRIMPTVLLPICLLLIYLIQVIRGYVTEIMRRRRVLNVFKQYVAPQIVDKISKDKDFELVLGGENRHVAVLFVDIRGFTTMSESLRPEEVVEILNEYLSLTTQAIFDHGGTLDKFVGDATMAVFNAPFDLDDYIYRAVCTAWDMQSGAAAIGEKCKERFGKSVSFGIGINCGNAVVGNIGCDFRMDYTAIGDTVNTAARLESNAAPGQILISSDAYEAVKDRVDATPIGEIPLKGKSQGVFVYQLDGLKSYNQGGK